MMDIVLAGGMGLLLAVLMPNPPREKVRPVTTTVVEETPPAKGGSKATGAKKK